VGDDRSTWNVLPHKHEAGTPNVGDAVGLAAACDYLTGVGMDAILAHEQALTALADDKLRAIPGVRVIGPSSARRSGVVSFMVGDIHPHDLATIFDEVGVCVRAGHHCAQPLMRRLNLPATARASFYIYNTEDDVDALVAGIQRAQEIFG
jgi:cysteine desulfurase/selenocysteine lyase